MSSLSTLAQSIHKNEFDGASDAPSVISISGWLETNVGTLNTHIHTAFSGENPALCAEESGIFTQLYLINYYGKQARNAARGIINSTGHLLEVRDQDHAVVFVNNNEVAKVFRGLANDCQLKLDNLVAKYNLYEGRPIQVAGEDSDQTIY